MKKVGILTSGGDCQGLNASIRGVAKALYEYYGDGVEIYGIRDGYRGLIQGDYEKMKRSDFSRYPDSGRHHSGYVPPAVQTHASDRRRKQCRQGQKHEAEL